MEIGTVLRVERQLVVTGSQALVIGHEAVDEQLGGRLREERTAGELLDELCHATVERIVIDQLVDKAKPQRLGTIDELGREQEALRGGRTDDRHGAGDCFRGLGDAELRWGDAEQD